MSLVSSTSFTTLVNRYGGDYRTRDFSCWKQFLCMAFGQLTHRESIRDTLICLEANSDKLYHMGIGNAIAVSTLTRVNENRSFQIYQDLAMHLIKEAKQIYVDDDNLERQQFKENVFAIDATQLTYVFLHFIGLPSVQQKQV